MIASMVHFIQLSLKKIIMKLINKYNDNDHLDREYIRDNINKIIDEFENGHKVHIYMFPNDVCKLIFQQHKSIIGFRDYINDEIYDEHSETEDTHLIRAIGGLLSANIIINNNDIEIFHPNTQVTDDIIRLGKQSRCDVIDDGITFKNVDHESYLYSISKDGIYGMMIYQYKLCMDDKYKNIFLDAYTSVKINYIQKMKYVIFLIKIIYFD
jgi:hypothetical protein